MREKSVLTSEEKVALISSALDEKKAIDAVVLDVRGRTLMADFFIVASGTSRVHIKALADAVTEKLAGSGVKSARLEGYEEASWVLLDYGDVVTHVFEPEQRGFYKLESYWTGAEKGSPPLLAVEER